MVNKMTGEHIWVFMCPNCMLEHNLGIFLQGILKKKYTKEYGQCKFCGNLTRLQAEIWV